jgi:hypothetical protein
MKVGRRSACELVTGRPGFQRLTATPPHTIATKTELHGAIRRHVELFGVGSGYEWSYLETDGVTKDFFIGAMAREAASPVAAAAMASATQTRKPQASDMSAYMVAPTAASSPTMLRGIDPPAL